MRILGYRKKFRGTQKSAGHGIPGSCNDVAGRAYEKIMLINEGGISER